MEKKTTQKIFFYEDNLHFMSLRHQKYPLVTNLKLAVPSLVDMSLSVKLNLKYLVQLPILSICIAYLITFLCEVGKTDMTRFLLKSWKSQKKDRRCIWF